jgi:hypothetical protein
MNLHFGRKVPDDFFLELWSKCLLFMNRICGRKVSDNFFSDLLNEPQELAPGLIEAGEDRSMATQALMQFIAVLVTLGIAIVTGLITGDARGKILAGKIMAEKILAGKILAGKILAGRILAGKILAVKIVEEKFGGNLPRPKVSAKVQRFHI